MLIVAGILDRPGLTNRLPREEVLADTDPRVRWVSAADKTRTPPDLEDRAAKYVPEANLILANRDFRVYRDMVDRWIERYSHVPSAKSVVREVVEEWFEQSLIESVLGIQSLRGSPEWTLDNIAVAWSEEALTAAVMQRYHVDMAVKRVLGSRLGSIRELAG